LPFIVPVKKGLVIQHHQNPKHTLLVSGMAVRGKYWHLSTSYSAILVTNIFNYMEPSDICKISSRMITTPLTIAEPHFLYPVPSVHA
jgi:hypothetical protein